MVSKLAATQNDPGLVHQESGFGFVPGQAFWLESTDGPLTAKAGGGRTGATQIKAMFVLFNTVASVGDSAILPAAVQGLSLAVINTAQNAMQVFALGSDVINLSVPGSTGVTQMGRSIVWYTCHQDGQWTASGIGSGFAGTNTTYSYQEGLTALAGGAQSGATAVTASTARFTTVASAGDSAILMPALPGLVVTVINAGAQIMNLFPAVGEQIDTRGANTALAIPPGGVADLYCTATGLWHGLVSATAPSQAYNSANNTTGFTLTGAQLCGGQIETTIDLTGTLGGNANVQLPTVAQLVTAMTVAGINPQAGQTFEINIIQRSAANTWTITTNTGWTLTGTMTLGATTKRKFYLTLTSLTAAVLRSIESSTVGAA